MKKLRGYYHILAINHYKSVVSEQVQMMVDSGLYDACEKISIGLLGNNEGLKGVTEIIAPYPKIKIEEYSTDISNYEFKTLKILKHEADNSKEPFYGFYIQTKAISYPKWQQGTPNRPNANGITPEQAHIGGNYLRDYMNHFIITKWKDNVAQLDLGYETCGTQLRPNREWKEHYSGNMWFFNSEYVKLLSPIETLNKRDRYECEFWLNSKHPIAATLCQHFADYNTKGTFKDWLENKKSIAPPKSKIAKKEGRNLAHTLCFHTIEDIEKGLRIMYEMNDKRDFQHFLIDCDFPLIKSDEAPEDIEKAKRQNSESLKKLALKYGSEYMKIKNVGVSQNWNQVALNLKLEEGDVLVGVDVDEEFDSKSGGWILAMCETLRGNPEYGYASLIMQEQFAELNDKNSFEKKASGYNIIDVNGNMMIPILALSGKFYKEMGGVPYPSGAKIYGGIEQSLWEYAIKLNYKWCMMKDYIVKHPNTDGTLLREWKNTCVFKLKELGRQIPFDEFLVMKKEGKI